MHITLFDTQLLLAAYEHTVPLGVFTQHCNGCDSLVLTRICCRPLLNKITPLRFFTRLHDGMQCSLHIHI
jgi:hypothetical protein